MIHTKLIDITQVPNEWIFEYYLSLGERLVGQSVNIKSVFTEDAHPSMYIFYYQISKSYRFKDFSSGKFGSGIELVKELLQKVTSKKVYLKDAEVDILKNYKEWCSKNKSESELRNIKPRQSFKVVEHTKRLWNTDDQKFWTQFGIGSNLLDKFKVMPLESFRMMKTEEDGITEMTIRGNYNYGYFRSNGDLYKIYRPYIKLNKFIKIQDYTQGLDQLTFTVPYLIKLSSLKDIMGFLRLGYKSFEAIAPDSENCLLPKHINALIDIKYKKKIVMFDIDEAGKLAMKKYNERYGDPYIILPMAKDLTDSIRDYGVNAVRHILTPLLKEAIK